MWEPTKARTARSSSRSITIEGITAKVTRDRTIHSPARASVEAGAHLAPGLGRVEQRLPERDPRLEQRLGPHAEQHREQVLLGAGVTDGVAAVAGVAVDEHGGLAHLAGQGAAAHHLGAAGRHELVGEPGEHGVHQAAPVPEVVVHRAPGEAGGGSHVGHREPPQPDAARAPDGRVDDAVLDLGGSRCDQPAPLYV